MKILNRTTGDEVIFKLSKFPDGQVDVEIVSYTDHHHLYQIRKSITSFLDLQEILCATAALKARDIENIELYTPYILGLRSDRAFVLDGMRYIKDVIAPILNQQGYKAVKTIDPHSYVAENCINNLNSISMDYITALHRVDFKKTILLSPDAGAEAKCKKVYNSLKHLFSGFETAKKVRVEDNIITTIPDMPKDANIVIIDDIIDGGGTLLGIRQALRDAGHTGEVSIIITHAIFSKGIDIIMENFDRVITTNSFQEFEERENLIVLKVI